MTVLMLKSARGSVLVVHACPRTVAYSIPQGWEEFILVTLLAASIEVVKA
jgi:hypothetical protein